MPPSLPSLAATAARIAEREWAITALVTEQYDDIRAFAIDSVDAAIAVGDIDPAAVERSVVAEVGLLCGVSPSEARRRLHLARDLGSGHVRDLFAAGAISERKVAAIVRATAHLATAHLDAADRAAADRALAQHRIETLGVRQTENLARWSEGGRTEFDNGRGLCAFHNLVRELAGWRATRHGNTVITTTPTGHTYASTPERHITARNRPMDRRSTPFALERYRPRRAMPIDGEWGSRSVW